MFTDTERIDFLESRKAGYGEGWVCRTSTTGRGYRLHETSDCWYGMKPKPTVREAIDDAIRKNKESKE